MTTSKTDTKKPRGFAALPKDKHREICQKGGVSAHKAGTAHEFSSEEARIAGRKGGRATHAKKNAKTAPVPAPIEEIELTKRDRISDSDYNVTKRIAIVVVFFMVVVGCMTAYSIIDRWADVKVQEIRGR